MGRRSREQGASLVEVMVASALLVLLLVPLVSLFGTSRLTALDSGRKSGAVNVARTWMERFMAMDWSRMDSYMALPSYGFTAEVPGVRWVRDFAPDPDQPHVDVRVAVTERRLRDQLPDDAMPDQLTVRDIIVTVRWREKDGYLTVQQSTTMHRR